MHEALHTALYVARAVRASMGAMVQLLAMKNADTL